MDSNVHGEEQTKKAIRFLSSARLIDCGRGQERERESVNERYVGTVL